MFLVFPLLVRKIGAEGFGVMSQINALNGILVPVATIGLGFSTVRLVAGEVDRSLVSQRFFSATLLVAAIGGVLACLVVLCAPVVNEALIKASWATPALRLGAVLILLIALEYTVRDYYRARLRIFTFSLFEIAYSLANLAGVLLVLTRGGGLFQVIAAMAFLRLGYLAVLYSYFIASGEVRWTRNLMPRAELAEIIRFGMPVVVMSLGGWLVSAGDRMVIGYFFNAREVGIYSAAYTLASVQTALAAPFWMGMYPLMADALKSRERRNLVAVSHKYSNGFCMIGIPVLIGLSTLSVPLLRLIGSEEFVIPPLLFAAIAIGLFSDQLTANVHYLLYLHNEPHFLRNVVLFSGVLNLALNLVLVPMWGIAGAAIATLIAYVALDVLLFRRILTYGYRLGEIYDLKTLAKYGLSGVTILIVPLLIGGSGNFDWLTFGGSIGLSVLVYAGVLVILNGFSVRRAFGYAN